MLNKKLPDKVTLLLPERIDELRVKQFHKLIDKTSKDELENCALSFFGSEFIDSFKKNRGKLEWYVFGMHVAELVAVKLRRFAYVTGHIRWATKDKREREEYLKDFAKLIVQDGDL